MCNESMVYLNKVFSDLHSESCPLLAELTASSENFNQQLTFLNDCNCSCGDRNNCCCGCGCDCFSMDDDMNFTVEKTEVFFTDFEMADPECLKPCQVTVDGIPVDEINFFNDKFMASTSELMDRVSDCVCVEKDAPTKGFFLICNAGPWKAKMTISVIGSVFGCGVCKRFKLCMTTKKDSCVLIPGSSTFAASRICLPCTKGGVAPVISFTFDAKGSVLNPEICIDPCGGTCNLVLTGNLVAVPTVDVQVTRQTLFQLDANTVNIPCDDLEKCRECSGTCQQCNEAAAQAVAELDARARDGNCCKTDCDKCTSFQFNGMNGCNF